MPEEKKSKRKPPEKVKLLTLDDLGDGVYRYEVEFKNKKYSDRFYGPGLEKSMSWIDKSSLQYKIWSTVLTKLKEARNVRKTDQQD